MNHEPSRVVPLDPFDAQLRAALRGLPHGAPPPGFAAAVAREAARRASLGERLWLLSPGVALVAATAYVVAEYGASWTGSLAPLWQAIGGATALNWSAATAACLALSWVLSRLPHAPAR